MSIAFANLGGLRPPPPPPRFFLSRAKLASKHTSPFHTLDASIGFCKRGGELRPPPLFCKAYESLPCEHCVCKGGGLRSPPNPLLSFKPGKLASKHASPFQTHAALFNGWAILLQNIRVASKPMLRALRLQKGWPFQTHAASIAFANGGGLRPQLPPLFLKLMLRASRLQLVGGGGWWPPNPPASIFLILIS